MTELFFFAGFAVLTLGICAWELCIWFADDHPPSCTFVGALDTNTANQISISPNEKFSSKACAYFLERRKKERQAEYEARTRYLRDLEVVQWSESSPDDPIFIPSSKN